MPLPPILRPAAKAYLLGYASVVGPRVLALIVRHVSKQRRRRKEGGDESRGPDTHIPVQQRGQHDQQKGKLLTALKEILVRGLDPHRFPAFCATIVGGSTILEVGRLYVSLLARRLFC